VWQRFYDRFLNRPLLTVSRSFINIANSVSWRMAIILKANKVNLFVSSVLFVFWYHSLNFLDTPRIVQWYCYPVFHPVPHFAKYLTSKFNILTIVLCGSFIACHMLISGWFSGTYSLNANVLEHSVHSIFIVG
jgi:hypothetical protein